MKSAPVLRKNPWWFLPEMSLKLVVLISGSGSNLQAIMDTIAAGHLDASIEAVISNKADAFGLVRARNAGIPTLCISHKDFDSREAFDAQMIRHIDGFQPDVVVLAGFMRILSAGFVEHYEGRLLNIHPSLLPKYKGVDTHARAIAAGDTEHGCSVHYVTAELDGGPVIAQAVVEIEEGDTPEQLAERVHKSEHRLYPLVLGWIAKKELAYKNGLPSFRGTDLVEPQRFHFFA